MPQVVHIAAVETAEEVRLMDEFTHQGAAARPVSQIDTLVEDIQANSLIVMPVEPEARFSRVAAQIEARGDGSELIALLPSATFEACSRALRAGAVDVLVSPTGMGAVSTVLKNLKARRERKMRSVRPLRDLEKQAIAQALSATRGSVSKSARLLGIGRSTLYRKLEQYELSAR